MDDDRNESELADDNHDNSGPTSSDQQPKATAKKVTDGGQAAGKGGVDLRSRTGGAYIPPARLRLMQAQITDKNSREYQKLAWEVSKKSITGLINKVNVSNIPAIVPELFKHNLIRTRGILCRILIKAQQFSPTFTHVYAALVAVINSKFPKIGELLLRRLIVQFRRYFQRNDKANCIQTSRFIAHLVNQQVAHFKRFTSRNGSRYENLARIPTLKDARLALPLSNLHKLSQHRVRKGRESASIHCAMTINWRK